MNDPKALQEVARLKGLLWEMHKIVFPGEYGLGTEPDSYPIEKEAWERLGELITAALGE